MSAPPGEGVLPRGVPEQARVHDRGRLAAVTATGLLDTPAEESFDDLARLATRLTGVPLSFITLVDGTRSYWKAAVGTGIAPDDVVSRQNTVDESFCQYLVTTDGPLVVTDARQDDLVRDNPSVEAMGVRAWAGYPVRGPEGHVLGSFCVVDTEPHAFTADDLEVLETLAAAASREVALRMALRRATESAAAAADHAAEAAAAQHRLLLQARASELLGTSLDAREVVRALGSLVVPELGDWAAVALPDDAVGPFDLSPSGDADRVHVVDVVHRDPARGSDLLDLLAAFPLSRADSHGVGRVLATGVPDWVPDVAAAPLRFPRASEPVEALLEVADVQCALTVPLTSRGVVLGAMTVSRPAGSDMDHALLADLGRRAGQALDNALSYAAQQRVGLELQQSLMPATPPTLPGVSVAARYLPATTGALAGGDFHQVVRRRDDLVLVLGDVEGHGMSSAARMGQLRAAVAALALEGHAPAALLERLAADTGQILDISLATLLVASFDPASRRLAVASAGHPPPVLAEPGRPVRLADVDPGPPLGAGGGVFAERCEQLAPGSTVVLYSDGLVERRGEDLDVGLERLRAAVEDAVDGTDVDALADLVLDRVGCAEGGADDIALLVLRS